jgi:hypothetical protein
MMNFFLDNHFSGTLNYLPMNQSFPGMSEICQTALRRNANLYEKTAGARACGMMHGRCHPMLVM